MDLAELGAFLRMRRDRTLPRDVGLPAGPRRRVPGLRRAEVAQLAGASPQYYRQLERAAAPRPSERTLAGLARALRLGVDERDHVFRLAGRAVPVQGGPASHVPPGLLHLLDGLRSVPAQVVTDLQVVLARNHLAALLFGAAVDVGTGPEDGMVHRWFTDSAGRRVLPEDEHDEHGRTLVRELSRAAAQRAGSGEADQEARRAVAALLAGSPEFAALWRRPGHPTPSSPLRHVLHPSVGVVAVERRSLWVEGGRQRLLWFTPTPGSDAAPKLDLLAVVGLHEFGRPEPRRCARVGSASPGPGLRTEEDWGRGPA